MTQLKLKGLLLIALLLLCTDVVQAYDLKKTNISTCYYNIIYDDDGNYVYDSNGHRTMELTYYTSYSGTIHIHQYASDDLVNYYYCTGIGASACYDCYNLEKVTFNSGVPKQITHIDKQAFQNCYSLSDIDLSGLVNLESLGQYAFYNCTSLTEVDLSNTKLTSIPLWAFNGCTNLKTVKLPSTLTTIGAEAFKDCTSLTSIEIPSSVRTISTSAFEGCTSLQTVTIDSSSSLTYLESGAFCNCTALTTVSGLENTSITAINGSTFNNCSSLTSITLPSTLTSIGGNAFSACSSLASLSLPSSITSIGAYAFAECTVLSPITLPSSLTTIGNSAFYECTSLASITIPSGVTSIGVTAFGNCTSLTSFTYNAKNCTAGYQDVAGGKNTVFTGCGSTLTTVTIGSSVQTIPEYLFWYCEAISTITIPSSVTSIGTDAFAFCTSLASVTYNAKNCTSIGSSAFMYCPIKTLTFGSNVESLPASAFSGWTSLTTISGFSSTQITSIPYGLFYNCSALTTSITIPSGVTSIGSSAFRGCSALTTVSFSNSSNLTSLGTYAFDGCTKLASVSGLGNTKLASIGDYAFYNCSALSSSLTMPDSLTSIGNYAFYNCSKLTSIGSPSSLTSLGEYAFYNCSKLTSIGSPDSLTSLGTYAFYNCSNLMLSGLENATITSIPDYVFYGCSSLTALDVPSKVVSIGNCACYNCTSLTTLNITSTVLESIGQNAFYNCPLVRIDMSQSAMTTIGSRVFADCTSLEEVDLPASLSSFTASTFHGCTSMTTVVVAEGNTAYETKDGVVFTQDGKTLVYYPAAKPDTLYTIPEGVTNIGEYAFDSCSKLATLNGLGGNSITKIGDYAFYKCLALTEVDVPNTLTYLGEYAFYCDSALVSVNGLGETTIPSIGDYAFYCCRLLTLAGIPSTVQSIGAYSFAGCYALTSIDIPSTVTSIGDRAFLGCSALETLTFEDDSQLETIGAYAFAYDASLESIEIPENVTDIGNCAFNTCENLTDVIYNAKNCLTTNTTNILYTLFGGCTALTNVTIGDGVETIPSYLFAAYNVYKVTSGYCDFANFNTVTIPASVKSIGAGAFYYCSYLRSIYSLATTPPECTGGNPFCFSNYLCTLYVPVESEYAYKNYSSSYDNTWSRFSTSYVKTFHPLDITLESDIKGDEDGYGYMTYYNGSYPYTMPANMKGTTVGAVEDNGTTLVTNWEYGSGSVVPAGTALLLYGPLDEYLAMVPYTSSGSLYDLNGNNIDDSSAPTGNWLYGSDTETDTYAVEGSDHVTDGYLFYKFSTLNSHNVGFYWGEEDGAPFSSPAHKAWLAVPTSADSSSAKLSFTSGGGEPTVIPDSGQDVMNEDAETTGIDNLASGSGDGIIYNIAGQRVNDMNRRGVYIVNGRKVVKK